MDITGSPFHTDVFDPSQVRVGAMPQGILGKCFTFECKYLLCSDMSTDIFTEAVLQPIEMALQQTCHFFVLVAKPVRSPIT